MIERCNDLDKKRQYIVYKSFMIRIIDSYWQDIHSNIPIVQGFNFIVNRKLNSKVNEDCMDYEVTRSLNCIKDSVIESIEDLKDKKIFSKEDKYLKCISRIQELNDLYCKFIVKLKKIIFENNEYITFYCYEGKCNRKKGNKYSLYLEDRGDMIITLTYKNIYKLSQLISLYLELESKNDFLIFDWRNISSGEQALLETYSKLYCVTSRGTQENILLLIDEGELYLHPEWQRQYIKMLVDYIPIIYKNKKVQIIFASNSPFLISDMPRNNIIILDKKGDEIIVSDSEIKRQTFGANISKLLNNSFFIENSMGDFAKSKIEEIINMIKNLDKNTDKEEKNYIKKLLI